MIVGNVITLTRGTASWHSWPPVNVDFLIHDNRATARRNYSSWHSLSLTAQGYRSSSSGLGSIFPADAPIMPTTVRCRRLVFYVDAEPNTTQQLPCIEGLAPRTSIKAQPGFAIAYRGSRAFQFNVVRSLFQLTIRDSSFTTCLFGLYLVLILQVSEWKLEPKWHTCATRFRCRICLW